MSPLPRIYDLKARNQKFFATHTPLRCRPALGTVDMYSLYLSLCHALTAVIIML